MNLHKARKQAIMGLRIERWRHPSLRCHMWAVVQGVAGLTDSLISVLTLGLLMSNIEMQVSFYRSISHHLLNKERSK